MKKFLSYLLIFSLMTFSLFSSGCRSSSAFKFLGAVVAIAVIASSGGAASPAIFAANLRGSTASNEIKAEDTSVKVYHLDTSASDLRGGLLQNLNVTLVNGKLICSTFTDADKRLQPGDYLFEAYHKTAKKPFLRALLYVDGTSNNPSLDVSPITEVKTQVYKKWVDDNPEVKSVANFEANLTKALKNSIENKSTSYGEKLAEWAADTSKEIADIDISDIIVLTKTVVEARPTANNPMPGNTTLPSFFSNATWRTVTLNDLTGDQSSDQSSIRKFYMRYNFNDNTKKWVKFTNTVSKLLPDISFMADSEAFNIDIHDYSGPYYKSHLEPVIINNELTITIPNDDGVYEHQKHFEYGGSFIIVNNQILVIEDTTILETVNARITTIGDKTYLHLRSVDDDEIDEIYELAIGQDQDQDQDQGQGQDQSGTGQP